MGTKVSGRGLPQALIIIFALICVAFSPAARAEDVKVKIILFGDSIVAGYGLSNPQQDSLPPRIRDAILSGKNRKSAIVEGMGVSGDTTSSALSRLPALIAAKPDIVMLALGGNDVLRGIDPDITFTNLDMMLKELKRNNIYVLLAGMKAPPSMGFDFGSRFNRIYPKLAEAHKVAFYPFLLEGVAGQPEYNQRDGIHPNPDGVKLMVAQIAPYLDKMTSDMVNLKSDAQRSQIFQERKRRQKRVRS